MSHAVQLVVVALLVAGAAVFATWRLISGTLRLRALETLLRVLPRNDSGRPGGLAGWLRELAARQRTATGCAACDSNPAKRS